MGSRIGGNDGKGEMGREEEEDDYDPQYTLFLRNLKASSSGTGYVLEIERGNGTTIVKYEDEYEDEDELQPSYERRRKLPRETRSREIGCGKLQGDGISCRYIGESSKGVERNDRCESSRDVPAPWVDEEQGQKGEDWDWKLFSKGSDSEFLVANGRSEGFDKGKGKRGGYVVSKSPSVRGGHGRGRGRGRGRLSGNPPVDEGTNVAPRNPSRGRGRGRLPGVSKRSAHQFRDEDEFEFQPTEQGRKKVPKLGSGDPHEARITDCLREMKSLGIVCGPVQGDGMSCRYVGESSKSGQRYTGYVSSRDVVSRSVKVRGSASELPVVNGRSKGLDKGKSQRQGRVVSRSVKVRRGRLNRNPPTVYERSDNLDKGKSQRKVRRGRLNGNPPTVYERSDNLDKGKSQRKISVVSRRRVRLNGVPPKHYSKGERGKEKVQALDPDKIEKDYYEFLSTFAVSGKTLICRGKNGIQNRYYEYERRSKSDAKGPPDPPPSRGRMTPQPSSKRLASSDKRVPHNQSDAGLDSEFRRGAMDVLLKPYDKKEHADLLKEAMHRTPHLRTRHLRGRQPQYPDESTMGKSILDHHGDLIKIMKHAQRDDPHKVLLLLRGFLYYMQHVCMEGAFKPWNDNLWLEAMSRSTS